MQWVFDMKSIAACAFLFACSTGCRTNPSTPPDASQSVSLDMSSARSDGATESPSDASMGSADAASKPDLAKSSSTVTPLPVAGYPVPTATDGNNGSYDGSTALTWNGNVILGRVTDPETGKSVNVHRIMADAPPAWGTTHRSERVWIGDPAYELPLGVDTWQAFAVQRKAGESLGAMSGWDYDELLVLQGHSPENGATQPPYSLDMGMWGSPPGNPHQRWNVSYNTKDPSTWSYNGGPNPDYEDAKTVHSEELMPEGVWWRYIVHLRSGYQASHNPIFEVWRAKPGQPYEKLFSYTGFNAYVGGNTYIRAGIYKWTPDSMWLGVNSIAFYMSDLYFGRGVDLYDAAVAALEGY
jgi:hypothetical protein